MHLALILIALTIAVLVRMGASVVARSWCIPWQTPWQTRWLVTGSGLLLPPLLLLTTAIAIVGMGSSGTMFGTTVSGGGYVLSVGFLIGAMGWLGYRACQTWRSQRQLRQYVDIALPIAAPPDTAPQMQAKLLPVPQHFAGQIGFWQSQLVVSQGLLTDLGPDHLAAVIAHEQAHRHYRDTFWFFWFGWLRSLTAWLPHSDRLWQEWLLLRELRADRWAAQRVDPLALAEALLQVVRSPIVPPPTGATAFHDEVMVSRFEERINALLSPPPLDQASPTYATVILGVGLILLPILLIPLHH
ncbi:M56 family metallopeptidase [Trichothermofontia sp.]